MLEEIFGVPTHPLVIHVVVVLLPVASLCAAAIALVPAWRRRWDLPVTGLVVLAAGAVPIAYLTGDALYDRRLANLKPDEGTEGSLIEQHRDAALDLWPYPLTLLVGTLLLVAGYRYARKLGSPKWQTPMGLVASAITLVGAVTTVIMVIKVGHAGSEAAWNGR